MATMYGHDVKSLCDPFIEVAGEERALEMIAATVYSSKHQVVIDVLLIPILLHSHSRVRYRRYLKNRGTSEFILCLLHFRQLRQWRPFFTPWPLAQNSRREPKLKSRALLDRIGCQNIAIATASQWQKQSIAKYYVGNHLDRWEFPIWQHKAMFTKDILSRKVSLLFAYRENPRSNASCRASRSDRSRGIYKYLVS